MGRSVAAIIDAFMESGPYAVVGASRDRAKFGNKVFRAYLRRGLSAYPVNPYADRIEGVRAHARLADLPEPVRRISVITPPPVTEQVVVEAGAAGVAFVWMQPGAGSRTAVQLAVSLGMEVINDGSCFLTLFG